jgi:hypothetical protein
LSPHPGTWMAVENAHVAQPADFHRAQFQTFHAVSLRRLLQALTANTARLLSFASRMKTAPVQIVQQGKILVAAPVWLTVSNNHDDRAKFADKGLPQVSKAI